MSKNELLRREGAAIKLKNITGTNDDEDQNSKLNDNDCLEPMDAKVMQSILKSMGVNEYEPRVIYQLLEFVHRYASEVLIDAHEYSMYADKECIDGDDIRLAIASRLNHQYAQVPSRELTMEVAQKRNSISLPPISNEYGVRLPPPQYQLMTTETEQKMKSQETAQTRPGQGMTSNFARDKLEPATIVAAQGTRNVQKSRNPIAIHLKSAKS